MGFFKKFAQKAHSLGRFGLKAGKAVAFGAKRVAHGASKYGKAVSNIATIGASVATALGQPEIAGPLIGLAKGASRIAERGETTQKAIKDVGQITKGLQKPSKKQQKESMFESPAPPAPTPAPPQQMMVFESDPPRKHKKGKK